MSGEGSGKGASGGEPRGETVHASCVLLDEAGVLIRGPSGSGKSALCLALLDRFFLEGRHARLVGDDRIRLEPHHGRLVARPHPALAGLIEIRGLGIRQCPFAPAAPVGLIVDLHAADAARLPPDGALHGTLEGVELPRIPVAAGWNAVPLVVAALVTGPWRGAST